MLAPLSLPCVETQRRSFFRPHCGPCRPLCRSVSHATSLSLLSPFPPCLSRRPPLCAFPHRRAAPRAQHRRAEQRQRQSREEERSGETADGGIGAHSSAESSAAHVQHSQSPRPAAHEKRGRPQQPPQPRSCTCRCVVVAVPSHPRHSNPILILASMLRSSSCHRCFVRAMLLCLLLLLPALCPRCASRPHTRIASWRPPDSSPLATAPMTATNQRRDPMRRSMSCPRSLAEQDRSSSSTRRRRYASIKQRRRMRNAMDGQCDGEASAGGVHSVCTVCSHLTCSSFVSVAVAAC